MNDNAPIFPFAIQNIRIVESAMIGTRLVLYSAHDPDNGVNGTISDYHIVHNNNSTSSNLFQLVHSINPDGDDVILIEVIGSLDREQSSLHILNISATDSGNPSLSGFVIVNVNVLDGIFISIYSIFILYLLQQMIMHQYLIDHIMKQQLVNGQQLALN